MFSKLNFLFVAIVGDGARGAIREYDGELTIEYHTLITTLARADGELACLIVPAEGDGGIIAFLIIVSFLWFTGAKISILYQICKYLQRFYLKQ